MISESDWKKFKIVREAALERLCALAETDYREVLSDGKLTAHGKHLYLFKLVKNYDKRVSLLFDDMSRSKAHVQMLFYRTEGLITKEEVESFSKQFQEQTNPDRQ